MKAMLVYFHKYRLVALFLSVIFVIFELRELAGKGTAFQVVALFALPTLIFLLGLYRPIKKYSNTEVGVERRIIKVLAHGEYALGVPQTRNLIAGNSLHFIFHVIDFFSGYAAHRIVLTEKGIIQERAYGFFRDSHTEENFIPYAQITSVDSDPKGFIKGVTLVVSIGKERRWFTFKKDSEDLKIFLQTLRERIKA